MTKKEDLSAFADSLREVRDRLRVKVNLAGKEARDEWDELEDKWEHFRGKMKSVGDELEDAGDDAKAAASLLGEELKEGYERVRKRLE